MFVACSMGPTILMHAATLDSNNNEVIVVGKFELYPKVNTELEQTTHWNVIDDARILNTVFMATGPEPSTSTNINEWKATIETQWNETFKVKMPKRNTWLQGATMYIDSLKQSRIWFPGGLFFEVPKNATVIYIGTLRYTRNEFNTIIDISIIDDYEATKSALNLPSSSQLTKSLMYVPNDKKKIDLLALLNSHHPNNAI